ncbi:MAG TPA: hypothetical protein VNO70_01115 [Blastocatellia bacterium]|nr:hypothetical protein [Blastocatellia bacterium]
MLSLTGGKMPAFLRSFGKYFRQNMYFLHAEACYLQENKDERLHKIVEIKGVIPEMGNKRVLASGLL